MTKNLTEEIMAEKFLTYGRKYHTAPGSTESPKQDKPKEIHTKTYYN